MKPKFGAVLAEYLRGKLAALLSIPVRAIKAIPRFLKILGIAIAAVFVLACILCAVVGSMGVLSIGLWSYARPEAVASTIAKNDGILEAVSMFGLTHTVVVGFALLFVLHEFIPWLKRDWAKSRDAVRRRLAAQDAQAKD